MRFTTTALTILAATSALAMPAPELDIVDTGSGAKLVERQSSCATGVHIIVARASTEPQGEGIIGSVASAVKRRIPGSDSVAVVYPATLYSYTTSQAAGARAMSQMVSSYTASCPDTKIVLMGYSQGAHVVGDTLVGASSTFGGSGVTATTSKNIVAAIQMGDPSFVAGLPVDVGTSRRNGLFPRRNGANLSNFNVQSYCDTGDTFCASGYSTTVHLSYVQRYGTAAADYVVSKATGSF